MVDTGPVTAVLDLIHDELSTDYPYHAALAASLAEEVQRDWHTARTNYCSGEWWGGAGSMFDLSPRDAAKRQKLAILLIELVGQFDRIGIKCVGATERTDVLKRWLATGIL